MKLIGEKIIIRDLSFKDEDEFWIYVSDPEVGPKAGWKPAPSKEIAKRLMSSMILSKETYCIALKGTNRLVGTISLYNKPYRRYEKAKSVGYSLGSIYWGHGIATEALSLMTKYAFTKTDCEILEVAHHVDNLASKRVIEKNGFVYEGRFRKYKKLYDGRVIDVDFYSMTKEEYERKIENE